ncbi:MAG: hypothetical protein GY802_22715, partial [Gammaproteobacteria bacterium]|nr:hypothetical protein [Gammaproteobacteria bacterium]
KIQVNGSDASSFTGTQLTAGQVTFIHDGSETVAASFDVNVDDGNEDVSAPTDSTFNFTVTPVNDAPVIGGVDSAAIQEDVAVFAGNISTSGSMTIADPDVGESSFIATTINGAYGDLVIDGAGNWSYSASNSQISIQALDTGESLTDTLTVTTFDGSTHDVVITINGAEDAAVVGGTVNGTVAEDGTLIVSSTLTITDTDTSDNPIGYNDLAPTPGVNGYGNFEITANTWTYPLNNGHPSVQALDVGQTLTDSYTFIASDGSTRTVVITIDGAEDTPVIGGTDIGVVVEDTGVVAGDISANGALTISDADTGESVFQVETVNGAYGDLTIAANGIWSYVADNSQVAIQSLDVGESLLDTLTVTSADGTTHDIVITINGAEDAAVIGGTAVGSVAEDGTLTASDTLTISDIDSSDNPISFNDVAPTPGGNGYGSFQMTGGTWTYTLNNGHAAVQALDAGESLTDTYTFTATDGSAQLVTVTIDGSEDAPTVDNVIADQSATEDVAFNFVFAVNTFSDLDASDTLTYTATLSDDSPLPAWLSFDGATRTFSGTPANGDVGAIDIKVSADDGSSTISDTFRLTINNTSDPAVIGGIDTGTVTEDVGVIGGNISTTGALTIADPDLGESSFQAATIVGGYGDLSIDTAGNWIYTADN